MPTFVALLRGINVGKHKRIAMADLRALLSGLGYEDVRTLLNSGNAVFTAPGEPNDRMARRIAAAIRDRLGLDVPVIVRTGEELARVVAENPFPERAADHKALHVEFLAAPLPPGDIAAMESLDTGDDDWRLIDDHLYLSYPNKLTGAVFVPDLSVEHTGRNWQTVTKLAAMTAEP